MKISVITTCFNRENTIEDTIQSLLAQDYPDIEYIIIDGNSSDRTMSIVNKYKDRISKIVSEPDHGMYEGLNKGIRAATGDIIGLLHSDDLYFSDDSLSHVARCFTETNADLLYGNGLFVSIDDTTKVTRDWISGKYSKSKISLGWLPLHTTVYIRRTLFEKLGYYNDSYKIAADSDLLVRYLYKADIKVIYLNNYLVRMRMGGLSTTTKRFRQKWKEDIQIYRNHRISPYKALIIKIISKIPQFIRAALTSHTTDRQQ